MDRKEGGVKEVMFAIYIYIYTKDVPYGMYKTSVHVTYEEFIG